MSHPLEFLFHPHSVALVGITINNPEHWTRTFLNSYLAFKFDYPLYLVNPKGGELKGLKVYRSLSEVPDAVDFVISIVPARAARGLIEECATKSVKAIHFCTSGFSEVGGEGERLEAELIAAARRQGIRIIGPNCMGIYCPASRMSFTEDFPQESGNVGFLSQSGGNATAIGRGAGWRNVRFSKIISYGNAADLNESDFLDYFAEDPETSIIAMYIEGVKDGRRFRRALEKATREKPVVLLKGGITEGGAQAAAGHTASLAGNHLIWESLCKQLGIIWVRSIDELIDTLVTLRFMPVPKGRNAGLIGLGGGASVLIGDAFGEQGFKIPTLPQSIQDEIVKFSGLAGNILRNPVDYGQNLAKTDDFTQAVKAIAAWPGIDFLALYFMSSLTQKGIIPKLPGIVAATLQSAKPCALVFAPTFDPAVAGHEFTILQEVARRLPLYYSFSGAASAIRRVMDYYAGRAQK